MEELISVIVPIYKTEKYLRKCVDSILNQTYKNLEIILVNDGSPDNSGVMCDEYANKNNRIKVINQKNGGHSKAVNRGLDIASGAYISIVDSDDYIHHQMLEVLYINLKKYEADISVCSYSLIYENEKTINNSQQQEIDLRNESIRVFNSKDALGRLYMGTYSIESFVWNKLYKKEVFGNIRYDETNVYADMIMMHKLLDKVSKVVVSNNSLYYYLQRSESETGKPFNFTRLGILAALEDRMFLLKDRGYDEVYLKTYKEYLEFAFNFYYLAEKYYPHEKGRVRDIKNMFIKLYKQHDNKHFSKKIKVKYDLFCISPSLQKVILNLRIFIYNNTIRNFNRLKENIK